MQIIIFYGCSRYLVLHRVIWELFRDLSEETSAHICVLFLSLEVIPPPPLILHPIQPDLLEQVLFQDHFLSRERVGKLVDPIIHQHGLFQKQYDLSSSKSVSLSKPPATFNKPLQRRLDRGQKQPHAESISYTFSSVATASP